MKSTLLAAAFLAALCSLARAQSSGEVLLKVFDKGKQGLADVNGRPVIATKYDYIDPDFSDRLARFRSGGKFGYVNRSGKEIIPAAFEGAADFSGGVALVIQGGRYGFIDSTGTFVFKPQFDSVGKFVGDFVVVGLGGKYGVVHRGGETILPCEYDSVRVQTPEEWDYYQTIGFKADDLAVIYAGKGEEYVEYYSFIVRPDGSSASERVAGSVGLFYDGLASFSLGDKTGFLGPDARIAAIPQYAEVLPFSGGRAWVRNAEGWGIIGRRGEVVVPPRYDRCELIDASTAVVREKTSGKCGLVSSAGAVIVPCEYLNIERYSAQSHNVLLATRSQAKGSVNYAFLTMDGKRIGEATCTPWNWTRSEDFVFLYEAGTAKTIFIRRGGKAMGTLPYAKIEQIGDIEGRRFYRYLEGGQYGILDENLEVLVAPAFSEVGWASYGCVRVKSGSIVSCLRFDGGRMASYPYAGVYDFSSRAFRVYKDGKFGFIRRSDGAMVTEPRFDVVWDLSDGMALVAVDYSTGNPYRSGWNEASGMKFDMIYNRGFDKGRFGYVDEEGRVAIQPVFDCGYDFSEGLAVVRLGDFHTGKRSYIDKSGTMIVNPSFNYAYSFRNGIGCVIVDEKVGYIDKSGRFIVRPSL